MSNSFVCTRSFIFTRKKKETLLLFRFCYSFSQLHDSEREREREAKKTAKMESNKDQIVDVRSVVEAVTVEDGDAPLYSVQSLCMRCGENGTTRFLLTLIPHFRKVLLSAFECPHCGERNNEVQFAGELQPQGCCYWLEVPPGNAKMLDRQVVKSESATIKIPELDFEIPPEAQRGSLSTIEGILVRAADELQALQEERKKVDPQTAEAIDQFLSKLRSCAAGDSSFSFILDDPAGNSFIENPFAPSPDPSLSIKFYERTPEQQATLGYLAATSNLEEHGDGEIVRGDNNATDQVRREPHGSIGAAAGHRAIAQSNSAEIAEALYRYTAPEEVMTFPSTCGACGARCETRMFLTKIPYFQEVIVMASTCDACGYRNSELKPGGRIPEKGKRITLCVNSIKDLSRDVIKSDTASVKVPELDLELASGTLGGVVTTVEGLITKISESLERVHGFTFGDSLDEHKKSKWQDFKARLGKVLSLEEPWTLILDDGLANSFIAPATDDIKDDHQLTFKEYERSWEQNEEVGLNDIDTSSADTACATTTNTANDYHYHNKSLICAAATTRTMGESELPPYPPIDPTTYDLIAIGTGLPESVLTAAASHSGKSVLHLDPNPFYGSHFSSLSLSDLSSFLKQNSEVSPPCPPQSSSDFSIENLTSCTVYSDVEISCYCSEISHQDSRKFNLDISGPRVLFCADKSMDLILKSGASQYLEFKSIDASFVGDGRGGLSHVPDSRAAIFKDKTLGLVEKNMLMRFFKLVQQHLSGDEEAVKISDEDLESPFVDFLTKMNLPQKIKWIILYAIAMADYDQENWEDCEEVLKTRDGIDRLALYNSSVGRFQNALGAMIYPLYGQGELPQAFCRRAAVKGCIHVLRMPVVALLMDKDSGNYKGVRLSSGQEIFSDKLVLDPSFMVQSPSVPLQESVQGLGPRDVKRKVARGICITSSSLKPDLENFLVVYPPRSLYPEQVTAIRVLQIGANVAVCPSGMFVWYLLALCNDVSEGKKLLNAAINALKLHIPDHPQSHSTDNDENLTEEKPVLLWSALYIQELTEGQVGTISFTPMPDGNLNYNDVLDAAVKVFQNYYPDEDIFPETTSLENSEDDVGSTLET